jgi:ornithine cyclodeaminase/alanine dehydrogenase-like protein (mu-crystallin family)
MLQLTDQQLVDLIDYPKLVEVLKKAFAANYTTPLRHHHNFENPIADKFSTFLLMPSWDNEKHLGVKLVTVSPENSQKNLPTIQGLYIMFDIKTGIPLMQCDARLLTVKRTAAASALASQYLSQKNSEVLLMIGTGFLSSHLIEAHVAIRPIKKVQLWGRNFEKAQRLAETFKHHPFEVEAIPDLQSGVLNADIISAATMSETPLIKGEWLQSGQHIDLVGSYLPTLREADDEVIRRSSIYVDNLQGAIKETGDIFIPIQKEILKKEDIKADLFQICKSSSEYLRKDEKEITLFKSVGHALEDLATASYLFEQVR